MCCYFFPYTQTGQHISSIAVLAHRAAGTAAVPGKDQNSCLDLWKSLPGSNHCPALPAEHTAVTGEMQHEKWPPHNKNDLSVLGTSQRKGKKHILAHSRIHWVFCRVNQHTSTYKKPPLYCLKITLHVEIRWLTNCYMTGPFAEHISDKRSFLHSFAKMQKTPFLPTFENN